MSGQIEKLKTLVKQPPNSLCILRLSAIGDVCHAVALLRHLQQHWPQTKITWIIGKVEYQLVKHISDVEFIVFDKKTGLSGYRRLYQQLRHHQFDCLFHMQVALRASLASYCVNAKIKIGFDQARAKEGQWLFTNAQVAPQPSPHVLDGFMAFANAVGLPPATELNWSIPIVAEDELWASEHMTGVRPFAVICPAASKAMRNWTVAGYAQCADYLEQQGFQVVLVGSPTDHERELAENIIKQASCEITNLVAKSSLLQLLAVLKLAHLVIAPDTGPAHMAVTVGTPVIGLYAHSNPERTGPYLYRPYVVSVYEQAISAEYHQPVNKLKWGIRAKGEHWMSTISLAQVTEKIDQLITDFYPELQLENN